jgi:hypothetical protein
MIAAVSRFDGALSSTRPVWIGLGQLALIVLGVHLAADRLDDTLYGWLAGAPIPWPQPDLPVALAAWGALAIELVVVARALVALALTPQEPTLSWATWKRHASVDAVVLPLFWAPVALAGAWVVGMTVEDQLATYHADAAKLAGWLVAGIVAWRLGWTGWKRVVGALDPPKRRVDGILWAPALLVVGAEAALHGLPIWGWWPW